MAFARGVGEYGSVIFIAGNMPYVSEIAPLLIVTQLEQFAYAGATAIATVMLLASFSILLLINLLQYWSRRRMNGRSEEHTSELQSLMRISYVVLSLKKKRQILSKI